MLKIFSTLSLLLLYFGFYQRKRSRRYHITAMSCAMMIDIILVLWIEGTRRAIERIPEQEPSSILYFHVMVSVLTVLFYFVMIISGPLLMRGKESVRSLHRYSGYLVLILRTCNYLTSYLVELKN